MALFGSDMTEVMTPDGRRITVPQQLAAQFPGLQPVPPPEVARPPDLPASPPFVPQPQDAPVVAPPPDNATAAPVTSPSQVPAPSGGPARPQGPVTDPSQQREGAPNAPRPMTDQQLRGMGNAGVYGQQSQAVDQQQAAVDRQAQGEADEWRKIGEVSAQRDERVQQILEEDQRRAAEHQQFMDGKMADYERSAKSLADIKIDRSVDHPILAAISVAMGAIGATLAGHGDRNPALDMLMKGIDRKVAAQMQDIDNRRAGLAQQRDILGLQRDKGRDEQGARDKLKLAAIDQAMQKIDTIKAQSNSPRAIANGDATKAALAVERGKLLEGAMTREQTKKQHEDQLKATYAGQAQSERHFNKTFDENVRQFDKKEANDLEQAAMAARAKGNEARAKQITDAAKLNEERGISDPTDGKRFLQPEGIKLNEQADKLAQSSAQMRAAAEAEQDPNKKQALAARADAEAQKASDLRVEVAQAHTWRVGDPAIAGKLASQIAATKTIVNSVDEIKALREKHGAKWGFSSEGEAFMQSKAMAITMALKSAWQLGVLSKQDVEMLNDATGGNPSNITPGDVSKMLGAEGVASRLEALAQSVESGTRDEMKAKGYRGDYSVKRATPSVHSDAERAAIDTLQGMTPVEMAADEERGAVGRVAERVSTPFGERPVERRQREDIDSGSPKYPGLSRSQEGSVDQLFKAYRESATAGAGPDAKKAKLAQEKAAGVANTLVSLATDKSRPGLQNAMLTTFKESAPELYRRALSQLPERDPRSPTGDPVIDAESRTGPPVVNQQEIADRERAVMAAQPVSILLQTAAAGDAAAKQELARRAIDKDKDAIRALSDLVAGHGFRPPVVR